MEKIVVTRHAALVEFLREIGLISEDTPIISHARVEDVRGKHVIGVLPLALAVEARTVTEVPLHIPQELRGKELSLDEVRMYAGAPVRYTVYRTEELLDVVASESAYLTGASIAHMDEELEQF